MSTPLEHTIDYSVSDESKADASFPYRSLIGSILYLSTKTRPDLSAAVSILAPKVSSPTFQHERGLYATKYTKLCLKPSTIDQLLAYVDSNWTRESGAGRKSRSGIAVFYGTALIYWRSTLQKCVTTSSTEAEYLALADAAKTIVWLRNILIGIGIRQAPTKIYEDNSGVIAWAQDKSGKVFFKIIHVDAKFNYVKELVDNKMIQIIQISTQDQKADFLTKLLASATFIQAKQNIGLLSNEGEKGC